MNRDADGRWQKGASANPGGRAKETAEVRELARQHTAAAIRTLAEIMEKGDKDAARVAAAEALLSRGWGRPEQAVAVSGQDGGALTVVVQTLAEVTNGDGHERERGRGPHPPAAGVGLGGAAEEG